MANAITKIISLLVSTFNGYKAIWIFCALLCVVLMRFIGNIIVGIKRLIK